MMATAGEDGVAAAPVAGTSVFARMSAEGMLYPGIVTGVVGEGADATYSVRFTCDDSEVDAILLQHMFVRDADDERPVVFDHEHDVLVPFPTPTQTQTQTQTAPAAGAACDDDDGSEDGSEPLKDVEEDRLETTAAEDHEQLDLGSGASEERVDNAARHEQEAHDKDSIAASSGEESEDSMDKPDDRLRDRYEEYDTAAARARRSMTAVAHPDVGRRLIGPGAGDGGGRPTQVKIAGLPGQEQQTAILGSADTSDFDEDSVRGAASGLDSSIASNASPDRRRSPTPASMAIASPTSPVPATGPHGEDYDENGNVIEYYQPALVAKAQDDLSEAPTEDSTATDDEESQQAVAQPPTPPTLNQENSAGDAGTTAGALDGTAEDRSPTEGTAVNEEVGGGEAGDEDNDGDGKQEALDWYCETFEPELAFVEEMASRAEEVRSRAQSDTHMTHSDDNASAESPEAQYSGANGQQDADTVQSDAVTAEGGAREEGGDCPGAGDGDCPGAGDGDGDVAKQRRRRRSSFGTSGWLARFDEATADMQDEVKRLQSLLEEHGREMDAALDGDESYDDDSEFGGVDELEGRVAGNDDEEGTECDEWDADSVTPAGGAAAAGAKAVKDAKPHHDVMAEKIAAWNRRRSKIASRTPLLHTVATHSPGTDMGVTPDMPNAHQYNTVLALQRLRKRQAAGSGDEPDDSGTAHADGDREEASGSAPTDKGNTAEGDVVGAGSDAGVPDAAAEGGEGNTTNFFEEATQWFQGFMGNSPSPAQQLHTQNGEKDEGHGPQKGGTAAGGMKRARVQRRSSGRHPDNQVARRLESRMSSSASAVDDDDAEAHAHALLATVDTVIVAHSELVQYHEDMLQDFLTTCEEAHDGIVDSQDASDAQSAAQAVASMGRELAHQQLHELRILKGRLGELMVSTFDKDQSKGGRVAPYDVLLSSSTSRNRAASSGAVPGSLGRGDEEDQDQDQDAGDEERIDKLYTRQMLHSHTGSVRAIACSSNGSLLFTAGADGMAKVWEAHDPEWVCTTSLAVDAAAEVLCICLCDDDTKLCCGTTTGTIHIFQEQQTESSTGSSASAVGGGLLWTPLSYIQAHSSRVTGLVWDRSASRLLSCGFDGAMHAWDLHTRSNISTVQAFGTGSGAGDDNEAATKSKTSTSTSAECTTLALGGSTVACGSHGGALAAFTVDSLRLVKKVNDAHTGYVSAVVVQADLLYSSGHDCSIKVWRYPSMGLLNVMTGHTSPIECLALSGMQLLSGSVDMSIMCWNLHTQTAQGGYVSHTGTVTSLHTRGELLFSGSEDYTVLVWRAGDPHAADGHMGVAESQIHPATQSVEAAERGTLFPR